MDEVLCILSELDSGWANLMGGTYSNKGGTYSYYLGEFEPMNAKEMVRIFRNVRLPTIYRIILSS